VSSEAQNPNDPRVIRDLMTGIFLAPIAAATHAQANYTLVAAACDRDWPLLLHITPVVALLASVYGVSIALRYRRENSRKPDEQRTRFLADFGLLFSGASILLILMSWIPVFLMSPCQ
jgi:hypothetical protein